MSYHRPSSRAARAAVVAALCGIVALFAFGQRAWAADSFGTEVQLPDCNSGKSHVKIIRSDSDWNAINDSGKRVFCVTPGNYRSAGVIDLRESGSQSQRRYLRYWDPSAPDRSDHPVDMSSSDRAVVRGLHFIEGDYWTVWGITTRGGSGQTSPSNANIRVRKNANHNVMDRMLVEFGRGTLVNFDTDSDDNIFQNGVIRDANIKPNDDNMCVNFSGRDTQRNKVVHSELYDCTDSVHVSPAGAGNNRGTVLAYNDMYINPDMYTDCNGNRDPNGNCACAENAIDVKAVQGKDSSSEPEKHWLKIIGNRMWGFQRTDTACGGTGSAGGAATVHYSRADFILARRNIIFDSPIGWTFSASGPNHVSFVGNIIWDISRKGLNMHRKSSNVEAYYNTIVDVGNYHSVLAGAPSSNDYRCNTAVNGSGSRSSSAATTDYNAYFNSDPVAKSSNDLVFSAASDAKAEKFCFDRKIWTGPKETCVPHVLKTSNSPHKGHCDPNVGSRSGTGVNNTTDKSFFKPNWRSYGSFSVAATADPARGASPLDVQLEAAPNGGSKPYSYTWTFGDGSTKSGKSVSKKYSSPGTYTPKVTVTDDSGDTAEDAVAVEVLDPKELVFSSIPHYGNAVNWEPREASRWSVEKEGGDKRYFLNTSDYSGADGNQPGEISLVKNRRFENFELTLSVRTNEDLSENTGADFVVAFGWQDADNYHFFLGHVQDQYTKLFTVENGERSLVTKLRSNLIPDESWHDVKVQREGDEVTISLDGTVLQRATLSTIFTGRVGVGSFNESVYYDDIDVKPRGGLSGGSGDAGVDAGDVASGDPSPDTWTGETGVADDVAAGEQGDAGDAGGESGETSGCSCSSSAPRVPGGLSLLLAGLLLARLARRRASERTESGGGR